MEIGWNAEISLCESYFFVKAQWCVYAIYKVWWAWSFQCRQLHVERTIKYGFISNYTEKDVIVNHESAFLFILKRTRDL